MKILIDFDGTVVVQDGRAYDDLTTPLAFIPGARDGLLALRRAGHRLALWSGRASLAGRRNEPALFPRRPHGATSMAVNEARYRQMLAFVAAELPGVFEVIDDGTTAGKPSADLIIDNIACRLGGGIGGVDWDQVAWNYGEPPIVREGLPYATMEAAWLVMAGQGVDVVSIGKTGAGSILRVSIAAEPGKPTVVLTAGQHGEEQAGPLALMSHAYDLVSMVRRAGLGLLMYPCINPEGFEAERRHNDLGEKANCFLQYQVNGEWVGELPPGATSEAIRPFPTPATESKMLQADMVAVLPMGGGFYALDLHQDSILAVEQAFAYVFGARAPYAEIMAMSAAPLADTVLKNDSWTDLHVDLATDADGLAEFYDGSLTDWLWRRGARMAACLETSVRKPIKWSIDRAWRWTEAFVRLAIAGRTARLTSGLDESASRTYAFPMSRSSL